MNRLGRTLPARALLWPSALGVALFYLLPFGLILYYSLVDNAFDQTFVGLDNYRELLHNAAFLRAAKNTALFSALAVPGAVGLSLLLSLGLANKIPGESKFRTALLSPLTVPVASVVLIWQILFHHNGAVNRLLAALGTEGPDWLRSGWGLLVVALLFWWKNLGYNMVLFTAAVSRIPPEVVEAAKMDGAGPWRLFWRVKWHYLASTALFVGILSLANSFKVFREVYLLSGNYPSEDLYLLQHYMNNMFRTLNYPRLSAAAAVMALVIGGVLAVLFFFEGRMERSLEE